MVVDGYRQLLLGLLLTDYVFVKKYLDLLWLGQLIGSRRCGSCRAVIFQDGIADCHALIANIGPRVIAGGRDQLGHRVLRLMTERTTQHLVRA